jgi:hypothetical protein
MDQYGSPHDSSISIMFLNIQLSSLRSLLQSLWMTFSPSPQCERTALAASMHALHSSLQHLDLTAAKS